MKKFQNYIQVAAQTGNVLNATTLFALKQLTLLGEFHHKKREL